MTDKYYIILYLVTLLYSCTENEEKQITNQYNWSTAEPQEHELYKLSHQSGAYPTSFNLKLITSPDHEIFYTTDGSNPTIDNGIKYTTGIKIKHSDSLVSNISYIPTTEDEYKEYKSWKKPKTKPNQANVIRFIITKNDSTISKIITNTYWIGLNPTKNKIPVLNISIDTADLFNFTTGIFIPGVKLDTNKAEWTGNYHMKGKAWEKEINLECFDNDFNKLINQKMGLRIHGLRTPIAPQKSLRIYTNGEPIDNLFFNDRRYENISRFILRTPFSCWGDALIKDILAAELTKDLNIENMHYKPCVLYINGEYWGLYNIRERTDKTYLANIYNLNEDSIHIIGGRTHVKAGNISEWNALWKIIESDTNISNNTYAKIETFLDIDEYIDYYIAEIFFSNYDWPANNVVSWKPFNDGKWRFMFYDLDATFGNYKRNHMKHATKAGVNKFPYNDKASLFIRSLLKNETFKDKFLTRFKFVLNNNFKSENTLKSFDKIVLVYEPFIEDQSNRWSKPESLDSWKEQIEVLRTFLVKRPKYVKKHLEDFFQEDIFED